MKRAVDWFLPGLIGAVLLAYLLPAPGARGGFLHPHVLNKACIALIFFSHGLSLSLKKMRSGALSWRVHLAVQSATFLMFPLFGIVLTPLLGAHATPELKLGLFYLCALPSTIASSVVLTAIARGNVPAAIFNATLSSILGVFLTPLWTSVMAGQAGHALPLEHVILGLCKWLLLPLLLGQAARPWLGGFATRHRRFISVADRLTILVLVYTAFCDSFVAGVWSKHGYATIAITLLSSIVLLSLSLSLLSALSRAVGFSLEDRITTMFCGSKKTLAAGVPMARLLFPAHPAISLILLPIMIYHPLQLMVCGALASRWARRSETSLRAIRPG